MRHPVIGENAHSDRPAIGYETPLIGKTDLSNFFEAGTDGKQFLKHPPVFHIPNLCIT